MEKYVSSSLAHFTFVTEDDSRQSMGMISHSLVQADAGWGKTFTMKLLPPSTNISILASKNLFIHSGDQNIHHVQFYSG